MRRHIQIAFWACIVVLCCALPAQAAVKSYTVLPFTIHGPQEYRYLSQGIRSMLVSRLGWEGNFEATQSDATSATSKDVTGPDAAQALRQDIGTDYLVWGSATIMGEEASLDVSMRGPEETTTKTRQTALDELIPAMEDIATELSNEVFGKPEPEQPQSKQTQTEQSGAANPNFVVNESGSRSSALNPQFRYEGDPNTQGRWRSQSLDFESVGSVVCDADGDGENEIFVLSEHSVHAYQYVDRRLKELDVFETNNRTRFLRLNCLDMNRDGQQEIVATGQFTDDPQTYILNFADQKFQIINDNLDFFANVVRTPPEYSKKLVGQKKAVHNVFENNVHRVVRMQGEYQLGSSLNLPEKATVFNFAYLPQEQDYKIVIAHNDKLQVHNSNGAFQSVTEEMYAGTGIKLEKPQTMPGLGKGKPQDYDAMYHFIPSRLIPTNLDREGGFEILVNRSMSVSAQFFQRYRNFPQGSIHSLAWDGVGLSIVWKTRTIKGTVIDYGLGDLDNDQKAELFVCVNTHPGMTGFKKKRTILLGYDIDIGAQELSELFVPGNQQE